MSFACVCPLLPITHTGWQDGLVLGQPTRPHRSGGPAPEFWKLNDFGARSGSKFCFMSWYFSLLLLVFFLSLFILGARHLCAVFSTMLQEETKRSVQASRRTRHSQRRYICLFFTSLSALLVNLGDSRLELNFLSYKQKSMMA